MANSPFSPVAVDDFHLERDVGHAIPKLGFLHRKGVDVDFISQSKIQELVLLLAKLAQFLLHQCRMLL